METILNMFTKETILNGEHFGKSEDLRFNFPHMWIIKQIPFEFYSLREKIKVMTGNSHSE